GGVTFDGDGYMEAGNGGEITIDGDVTALSLPDNSIEAQLMVLGDAGEITVNGDVTTSGILAWLNYGTVIINGNAASTSEKAGVMFNTGGGSVTIEGTFTANAENYVLFWDYLEVDNLPVAKSDGVLNGEYYEWDGKDIVGGADPTVLRVNASYFDDGTGDGGEDGTGDGGEDGTGDGDGNDGISRTILIIIVIIILAVIIGLLFFFLFWKKREEEEEEGKEQQ
ncbi:MAG: hypothetical protein FWG58_00055, partial [Methanomassiliicoccaceae archaeon]|nr:hypothetical protein [Methanomassiliicoccaceae archaeon]